MMDTKDLLHQLQTRAVDPGVTLSELLRQLKILAFHLNSEEVEQWIRWESEGYPSTDSVPDYRVFQVTVKGNFVGTFGRSANGLNIPSIAIPDSIRDNITNFKCTSSIHTLEVMIDQAKQAGRSELGVTLPDLHVVLGTSVFDGFNCISAWNPLQISVLEEIINTVRNRSLDFILGVCKELRLEPGLFENESPSKELSEKVVNVFNNSVIGSVSNIESMSHSSISSDIGIGNKEQLVKYLANYNVDTDSINGLITAIDSDLNTQSAGDYGPNVTSWLSSMIAKAASGTWDVSISAAGTILGTALSTYYGLST